MKDGRANVPGRMMAIAILVAGVVAFMLLRMLAPQPEVAERVERLPLVEVMPLIWEDRPLEIRGEGVVQPRTRVTLSAQVSGWIVRRHRQRVACAARFRQ